MAQTAQFLTQNAPPPGYETAVTVASIDTALTRLPSWYATVSLTFDGLLAANRQKTTAKLEAQIYSNELNSARRVLFSASGAAFGVSEDRAIEAVRLGNDYFVVAQSSGTCGKVTDAPSRKLADLTVSSLIGGIKRATPTGQRDTIHKLPAWEYAFLPSDVTIPILHADADGRFTIAAGDLWFAPSINVVARYTLTLNVENVTLLQSDQLVTGQLRATYELQEVGTPYNIAIPFGC